MHLALPPPAIIQMAEASGPNASAAAGTADGVFISYVLPNDVCAKPSIEQLTRLVFPEAKVVVSDPILGSYSDNVIDRLDVDGSTYILKRLKDPCKAGSLAGMQHEIDMSLRAAAMGLGPAVIAADPARGYFVSEFIRAEYTHWDEANQEPKRSALLRTLAELHRTTQKSEVRRVGHPTDVEYVAQRMKSVQGADRADGRLLTALGTVDRLAIQLAPMTFRPATCHGDIHAFNALYTPQQIYLIDWEQSYEGDPMEELASTADQIGVRAQDLRRLAADYGIADAPSLRRLELYYSMRLALRLIEAFADMPWNRAKPKSEVIAVAHERFEEALPFFVSR